MPFLRTPAARYFSSGSRGSADQSCHEPLYNLLES